MKFVPRGNIYILAKVGQCSFKNVAARGLEVKKMWENGRNSCPIQFTNPDFVFFWSLDKFIGTLCSEVFRSDEPIFVKLAFCPKPLHHPVAPLCALGCPGKREKCSNLHDSFHGGAFWSQNHSLEVWGPSPKGQPRNLHLKVSKVIKAIRKINVLKSKN